MDNGQILLADALLPDLAAQLRGRRAVPGQHHQPRGSPVQPVDRADIRLLLTQLPAQQLRQAAGLIGGEHPGRLDANNYILVQV